MGKSLYYEDFEVGTTFQTARRTVTEADVMLFAGLSGDFSSLHTDAVHAARSQFGQRIAHGLLVTSLASGLFVRLGLWDETALAFLSSSWTYKAPVFFGDTIAADIGVVSRRETRNPERGIVSFKIDVVNQNKQIVQQAEWVQMFLRRPANAG